MMAEQRSEDLTEWWEYYKLKPWGPERDDARFAQLCNRILGGNTEPSYFAPEVVEASDKNQTQGMLPGLVNQFLAAGIPVKFAKRET